MKKDPKLCRRGQRLEQRAIHATLSPITRPDLTRKARRKWGEHVKNCKKCRAAVEAR